MNQEIRETETATPSPPPAPLFTNHAHVLIAVSRNRDARQTDIAHTVGITTGAVQRIVNELEAAGYLTSERRGRRNRYTINGTQRLQHRLETTQTVQNILDSIEG